MNDAEVSPAGITTLAGSVAADEFELESATAMPPVGAGPESVTVTTTFVVALPFTVVGVTLKPTSVGAVTVRFAV